MNRDVHILHCANKYYKQIRGQKRQWKICNFKISIFHVTWFAKAHLNLTNICRFIAYFLYMHPPHQNFLTQVLQITDHTVIDWTYFCREINMKHHWLICIYYTLDKYIFSFFYLFIYLFICYYEQLLMQWVTDHQQQIDGPNIIVEIDEVKLGKRKK